MRPQGDARAIILGALCQHGPLPTRDVAAVTQVGFDCARRTVDNLKRAGVVEIVGHEKRAHCTDWVAVYGVVLEQTDAVGADNPADTSTHNAGFVLLGDVLNTWR